MDFEKLGVFYLGKHYDLQQKALEEDLLLYDAKDLTTHALIIGMTGSGKTGLGISLIEEAALDSIPVIAIDPKGDLGNLLLTFPNLSPADFQPWINQQEAANSGVTAQAYAETQANAWRKGLEDWGQSGERIGTLRNTVDLAIYTPGSSAGRQISMLRSFSVPTAEIRNDPDLYNERIQATATSVLTLMGIGADPLTSREHVLIANILSHTWNVGQDIDVAGLVGAILQPPIERIGVLDIESFYPAKERSALAMQLNNLLAAPVFAAWMQGEPLDAGQLLYSEAGRPRVSILSIAHLSDQERMFFVSMLLTNVIDWMRRQPGTPSLRAILYMDEIFGYVPPVANPPTKPLILTLLKQARAFGLGVVLATQNPVDLDYKGLSNIGTWFIGRLQTERDKARVMEGLEGAAAGGTFDRQATEQTLASLGKRVFYMHSVHDNEPTVFTTRWVMSYLAGPLTREQIKQLMGDAKPLTAASTQTPAVKTVAAPPVTPVAGRPAQQPVMPSEVKQYFLPAASRPGESIVYQPVVIAAVDISYANARYDVQTQQRLLQICEIGEGSIPVDWANSQSLDLSLDELANRGSQGASYAGLPTAATIAKNYAAWEKLFTRWVQSNQSLQLFRSALLKVVSQVGESERDFRIRLQQTARERRDEKVAALRSKYATRLNTLGDRLRRAEQAVAREQEQEQKRKLNAAMSIGSGLLGAFMGGRRGGVRSAVRGLGQMQQGTQDVERAEENVAALRTQLADLEQELQAEIAELESTFDVQSETLETVTIAPKSSDIHVHFVGLGWLPQDTQLQA